MKTIIVARSCVFHFFFAPRRIPPLLFLFLCLFIQFQVSAQDNQSQQDEIIRVDTNLITTTFFVTDSKNNRVGDLIKTDFRLTDNGKAVQITHFASGSEKVALMFALDASGSVKSVIEQERAVALSLAQRFGPASQISVVQFSDSVQLIVPFTNELDHAAKGFIFKAQSNRRTAIFDSLSAAIKVFSQREPDPTERKIIILISDGLDNLSKTRPQQIIEEANHFGISIYVLHLPLYGVTSGGLSLRSPSKGFRELAPKTGGTYFKLGDEKTALMPRADYDLKQILQNIEDDLKSQYVLGYYLDDSLRHSPMHKLALTLLGKDKSKFRVRLLRDTFKLKGQ